MPETLSHYLSRAGVASRRAAAELVKAGQVTVNGECVLEPGFRPEPGAEVRVAGKIIQLPQSYRYYMLNKPRGYVSSNADIHAELKAIDLLPADRRLFSAGRLDKDSEGLLIFSDDGDYVLKLTHPRYRVLKRYHVEVSRPLTAAEQRRLTTGIVDAGEELKLLKITSVSGNTYEVTLNEGKKREIRRLTAAVGAPTLRLRRVAMGKLELGDLPLGKFRELTPAEVAASQVAE